MSLYLAFYTIFLSIGQSVFTEIPVILLYLFEQLSIFAYTIQSITGVIQKEVLTKNYIIGLIANHPKMC